MQGIRRRRGSRAWLEPTRLRPPRADPRAVRARDRRARLACAATGPAHRHQLQQAAAARARVHADLPRPPGRSSAAPTAADRAHRARRQHVHAGVLRGAARSRPTRCSSSRASTARACSRCSRRTSATPRWSRTASRRATSSRGLPAGRRRGSRGCARTSSRRASSDAWSRTTSPARWSARTLLDVDPETGAPLDYIAISHGTRAASVARRRSRTTRESQSRVHMIGFAKVIGDIADGALSVRDLRASRPWC